MGLVNTLRFIFKHLLNKNSHNKLNSFWLFFLQIGSRLFPCSNELQGFSIEGLLVVKQYFPEFEFLKKLQIEFIVGKQSWIHLWLWVVLGNWLGKRNLIKT